MKHYIVAYDDHGHPLHMLCVKHSAQEAEQFINDLEEWDGKLEWEKSEIENIEGIHLAFCFGDAQYVIIELDDQT